MKKKESDSIEIVIDNPPTKEEADKRIKELAKYLEKIWKNPQSIS